jgi:thiosulfate dehydrogenase [quinone] large subunit
MRTSRFVQPGWVILPLRAFLAVVFLYAGISKIADRRFLDGSSPVSIHATIAAVRHGSPIGWLLGPAADHSFAFGLAMSVAEIAVGLGVVLGLFTRVAAAGGMLITLSLWLTVSWQSEPWFTGADVVYFFALTPLLIGGSAGVLSLDAWLDQARDRHPGAREDRTRRAMLAGGAALLGGVLAGGSSLFRRSSSSASPQADRSGRVLVKASEVPVGKGKQVRDPATGHTDWVLQLQAGQFTAYDATCPHQGCSVDFVSAAAGFACPCHGSRFDAGGRRTAGPAPSGLTAIQVSVEGGEVRST